jgi:antagonist of KipI
MPPTLEILKPGLFTTIQDLGRYGYQKYGVSVSGCMDFFSHRVANRLVGNDDNAATLECTILGPSIRFLGGRTVAITGADLSPHVDARDAPMWQPIEVKQGNVLTFGGCRLGCRAYVAVAGGIDVPRVLKSRATHVRTRLGGLDGRALRKGDLVSCLDSQSRARNRVFRSVLAEEILKARALRFLLGPQEDFFTPESIEHFAKEKYRVSSQSDRMGIRFEGRPLKFRGSVDIVSDAVPFGTIQVPSNGQPIVLGADRQTTGGYPKIGVVITADLPVLAQLKPGDELRFLAVNREQSLEALRELERASSEDWEEVG